MTEALYPFADHEEARAHFNKTPNPAVAHTYWGDELSIDKDGKRTISRKSRRISGTTDLSDWGRAVQSALRYGVEKMEGGAPVDEALIRTVASAQTESTGAVGDANKADVTVQKHSTTGITPAEGAAPGIAAALTQAALDEQVRPLSCDACLLPLSSSIGGCNVIGHMR
jgi:hypothetical protein